MDIEPDVFVTFDSSSPSMFLSSSSSDTTRSSGSLGIAAVREQMDIKPLQRAVMKVSASGRFGKALSVDDIHSLRITWKGQPEHELLNAAEFLVHLIDYLTHTDITDSHESTFEDALHWLQRKTLPRCLKNLNLPLQHLRDISNNLIEQYPWSKLLC